MLLIAAFFCPCRSWFFPPLDFDDTSHTDENDVTEAERRSGSVVDVADFATMGPRLPRTRHDSHHSDSESEEDELRSLDESPIETTYVVQQEEEFGSVLRPFIKQMIS